MIRTLLATTAIATLVATGAYAQTTTPTPVAPMEQPAAPNVIHADGHLASRIIGQTVYNSAADDAENIGSINDIVISNDGDVEAVVIGVGGFLGIGRKDVAIEYNLVEWTERDGDRWAIVNTTREALEAQQEFDVSAYRPLPADTQVGNTKPATAQDLGAPAPAAATDEAPANNDTVAVAPADDTATAPADDTAAAPAEETVTQAPADEPAAGTDQTRTSAIDRSALTEVQREGIRSEDFVGTTVYGANDENVGSVGDVVMSQDGQVEAVILDVGGFLGIGSKEVAVGMDNLSFLGDGEGNMYLYTPFTREQLEAQPEYDADTYAASRDDQLLIVPVQ